MTEHAARSLEELAPDAAEHFQDLSRQAHAARLGMWVFLSSEVLFFAGLFGLYAAYRVEHPAGFGEGVLHNTLALGSTNTAVLLVSSYTIALAVHELRRGKTRAAIALAATICLGLCFLGIKTTEYLEHSARASTLEASARSIPRTGCPGSRCSSPSTSA
jgi:cytochrome c oxidase subunit III